MSDAVPPPSLRPRFWETVPLTAMTPAEWEALCDGCGKCCLNKLEDEDTGEVVFTRIACRLFDDSTCRCGNYPLRKTLVPECVVLTPQSLPSISHWMPKSCAYRRINEGRGLADWHPLISGRADSVHEAGASMQGATLPEYEIPQEDWEDHLIDVDI